MIEIRHRNVVVLFAVITASIIAGPANFAAQSVPARAASKHVDLRDVPQPDLSGADPAVQEQIHAAQSALSAALAKPDVPRIRQAESFGALGEIYQAYGFDSAALGCYTNASRLDTRSFRWSYFAGYLGQTDGDTDTAERDYLHALTLKPSSIPALLRLGNLELTLNRFDAARQYFTRAAAQQTSSGPALAGLGKVALVQHQYSIALKYFTQALAAEPRASSIHYQLAMAYRALGDTAHMQEQLQARGDVEPAIPDPLLDEIDALKKGKFGLLERGNTAMIESRFGDAVDAYRQMVHIDPADPVPYKYLGVALARSGQPEAALSQYERALQLDPTNAAVHYNIGILRIETKKEEQAITHFQQALKLDPGLVAAHFQLANLFMRKRDDAGAEREYGIVVSLEPQNAFGRLMQAMAAVHAGSYARARALLEEACVALPDDPDLANALARLLAAAPDPAVRDEARGLRIVESLVNHEQGDPLEVGITFAMALAAAGRFQQAAGYQEAIVKQLEASRQYDLARPLRQDLARYRQGKTCSAPWSSDDPIFTPAPSNAELSTETKTTRRPGQME